MHTSIFIVASLGLMLARADDAKPTPPERTDAAVRLQFQRDGEANFYTACYNVTREVARKQLTIYAIGSTNSITVNDDGYGIEVIPFSRDAAPFSDHRFSGAYWLHHNFIVLSFAAAQFSTGNKRLALRVVRLLADAHRDMIWTAPPEAIRAKASEIPWSNYEYPPLPIAAILDGLQKDDENVRAFLKFETRNWELRVKKYGP